MAADYTIPEDEYRALLAEVRMLADERDEWRAIAKARGETMGRMGDENAKLRGLIHAAWRCIHTGASCSDCRLIAGGCTLQSAMRELGIEVKP